MVVLHFAFMYVVMLTIQYCSTFLWYRLGYVHKDPDIFETTYFFTRYDLPLNPKIKIWILICGPYLFPTEVVERRW